MNARMPTGTCGVKGCGRRVWRDGDECSRCAKVRRADNDRAPVESLRDFRKRLHEQEGK